MSAAKHGWQRANYLLANIFMQGFAPRKHPAPGLQPGLHRKTAFCFSSNSLYSGLTGQHPPVFLLYRALRLTAASTLTPGTSRPITSRQPTSFYRANLSLPPVNTLSFLANSCRQNSKPIYKNNHKKTTKKRKPKLP